MAHRSPLFQAGPSSREYKLDRIARDHMHDGEDNDRHAKEDRNS
jgi:hypothetical protein